MTDFTPMEHVAIAAIVAEAVRHGEGLEQQISASQVLSRKNTGGGFFTALDVSAIPDALGQKTEPLGQNVYIGVDGLEYGLGMILHFKDGKASLLEGYSVGGEDTSAIDFAHVRYALISKPGPLPTNGR